MSHLAHIADRVINRPLLILPEKLGLIAQVLSGRIGIDAAGLAPDPSRFAGNARAADPYRVTTSGTAIIPVVGSLVNRGAWIGAQSGLTSYEGIQHQLQSAARDPKVKSIVLDLDSPGGEAVGAFETAALVRKVNQVKPVFAMVNGMAASAAYAIASAAKAIISTESAISGSIGVVLMHADYSRAIDKAGITPTLIHAGRHKVDGSPYKPLPKGVRADLQKEVDAFYSMFLESVAAGRGARLTADAARKTEARTYIGAAAKKAGLVDDIGSFDELLTSITKSPARAKKAKGTSMIDPKFFDDDYLTPAPAAAAPEPEAVDAAFQKGIEVGKQIGANAERARLGALLSTPLARSNLSEAVKVIFETNATEASLSQQIENVKASRESAADASWREIAEKLNAEQRSAKPVAKTAESKPAAEDYRPEQAGALSVNEIMRAVNAESRKT